MNSKITKNNQNKQNESWKEDFALFFADIMPNVYALKKMGHVGSIITQFFVLRIVLESRLNDFQQGGILILSIILGLIFSLFIEKGFDTTITATTKQIVRWKFSNIYFKIMFFIIALASMGFLVYSPLLSASGGELAGNEVINDYHIVNDSIILSERDAEINKTKALQTETERTITKTYFQKTQATKNKYKAQIIKWDRYYNEHKAKDAVGVTWAGSHMKKAIQEKAIVLSNRANELAAIEQDKADELLAAIGTYNNTITETSNLYKSKQQNHNTTEFNKQSKRENTKGIFSYLGKLLGFISVLTCLISIIIIQIYNYATGVDNSPTPFTSQNKGAKLAKKLDTFIDLWFWEKLLGIDLDNDGFIGKPTISKNFTTTRTPISASVPIRTEHPTKTTQNTKNTTPEKEQHTTEQNTPKPSTNKVYSTEQTQTGEVIYIKDKRVYEHRTRNGITHMSETQCKDRLRKANSRLLETIEKIQQGTATTQTKKAEKNRRENVKYWQSAVNLFTIKVSN